MKQFLFCFNFLGKDVNASQSILASYMWFLLHLQHCVLVTFDTKNEMFDE